MNPEAFRGEAGADCTADTMGDAMKVALGVLREAHDEFAKAGARTTLDYDAESHTLTLQQHRLVIRRPQPSRIEVLSNSELVGAVNAMAGKVLDAAGAEVSSLDEYFGGFTVLLVQTAFPRAPGTGGLSRQS